MMQKPVKPEAEERHRHPPWVEISIRAIDYWALPGAMGFIAMVGFQFNLVLALCVPSRSMD